MRRRSTKVPNYSNKNVWISKKSLGKNILEASIFNALVLIFFPWRCFGRLWT